MHYQRLVRLGEVGPAQTVEFIEQAAEGMRTCRRCLRVQHLDRFYPDKRTGKTGWCKDCFRIYNQMKKYGVAVTPADACAICGSTEYLNVDHCHQTGDFRGVLCAPCNRGLGQFRDDVNLLRAAMRYLDLGSVQVVESE